MRLGQNDTAWAGLRDFHKGIDEYDIVGLYWLECDAGELGQEIDELDELVGKLEGQNREYKRWFKERPSESRRRRILARS